MRVLLINPPYRAEDRYGRDMAKFGPTNEPLGLAYLAGMAEKHGHEVQIWDGMVQDLGDIKGADVVGVTMLTPMYGVAKQMITAVRGYYAPKAPIIVGGPHPTAVPHETLDDIPEIDYLIQGDGEYDLIDYLENVKHTRTMDLDDLPLPARHLLPMDRYQMTRSRRYQGNHAYTVIVARGCPFKCGFCSRIHGRKVRFHSVDRVLDEVEILVRDYNAKEINFEADTLTLNGTFVTELCTSLIDNGFSKRIRWTCESRIDTVIPDMLELMKRAGCWQISYGVETGAQRLLDLIQKGTRIEQIEKTFAITKKAGVSIRAFYMLGLPTESAEETKQTITFAKKLAADWSQFTLYTPFPGTPLWDLAQGESPISKNWSDFRTHVGWTDHRPAWTPKGRSPDEMKIAQKWAYRAVYLRPKAMIRLAKSLPFPVLLSGSWTVLKTIKRKSKLVRVDRQTLKTCSRGNYVDSPVYFNASWPVRELNWRKLGAVLNFVNGEQGTALDLGCGNGVLLPSLSKIFDKVVGVDLHTGAACNLMQTLDLPNSSISQASADALPFSEKMFNAVFATSCMEHFLNIHPVLFQVHRVMKDHAKLFFLSPTENSLYRVGRRLLGYKKPKDHYWSSKEIEDRLKEYFKPLEQRNYPAFLPVYRMGVWEKRR